MNESEFDALLGLWFHEGADNAPARVAENAMLEVATTSQERNWLAAIQSSFSSAPLAWAAVVIVALAIGFGLAIGPGLVGNEPSPSPRPSESPTPGPHAMTLLTSVEDGYEVLIPDSWSEAEATAADARKWVGPEGEFTISYGASVFDGGEVSACAPPMGDSVPCWSMNIGYQIPYTTQYSLDSLRYSLEGSLDRCNGGCPLTTTSVTIGIESGGQHRLIITDRQLTYAYAIHNYRPVILYWSQPAESDDPELVNQMRDSFGFLDDPLPPGEDPTDLVPFTNPADGYEVAVPGVWEQRPFLGFEEFPGLVTFGHAVDLDHSAVTISAGDANGTIYLCDGSTCQAYTATTLDELQEVVNSKPNEAEMVNPDANATMDETHTDVVLGGEPGRTESVDTGFYSFSAPTFYSVYAIHDGRPFVLSFDHWTIVNDIITIDGINEILASFRFLD